MDNNAEILKVYEAMDQESRELWLSAGRAMLRRAPKAPPPPKLTLVKNGLTKTLKNGISSTIKESSPFRVSDPVSS